MKIKLNAWYDEEDQQAIEKLRVKQNREHFSDMLRLVIKAGINHYITKERKSKERKK